MKNEPSIKKLEELIEAFRKNGGTDAELSLVARRILGEYKPEKQKPVSEIFSNKFHDSLKEITELKMEDRSGFKIFIEKLWGNGKFRYSFIFVISFIVIFSVLNLPLIYAVVKPTENVQYETVKEVVRQEQDKSAPLEPGEVVPAVDTLVVPKLDITAPLVFIESINEADIHEGLRSGVVHYDGTAVPGENGNSFITGHSSNYWWDKGNYNYIFANLNKISVGDQAKIYYKGNKFLYEVKSTQIVEATDTSVLAQSQKPTLTLMTCYPPGTSWKRYIVKLDQISPVEKDPIIVEKQQPITVTQLPNSDSNKLLDWIGKLLGF